MNLKQYIRPGKGAADITPLLKNASAFSELINRLAIFVAATRATNIACIEGRGIVLGSAVAYKLKLGLVLIRRKGKLKNQTYSVKYVDYSGNEKVLEIHKDSFSTDDKVIIIDDWIETSGTIQAAIKLVHKCGAEVTNVLAFMDDSDQKLKKTLKEFNYMFLEKTEASDKF